MSELTWTKKTPTEPGWYWWRQHKHQCGTIAKVYMDRNYKKLMMNAWDVVMHAGEWAGPIPAPTEEEQNRE